MILFNAYVIIIETKKGEVIELFITWYYERKLCKIIRKNKGRTRL